VAFSDEEAATGYSNDLRVRVGAHKVPGICEAIEAAGESRSTCRPIRRTSIRSSSSFAKLKALLRKAAERSVDALWNRIADLLAALTPDERANYCRNAGYAPR
jgi:hypothetical protein